MLNLYNDQNQNSRQRLVLDTQSATTMKTKPPDGKLKYYSSPINVILSNQALKR